jgi:Tol biopolymer transport system component
MRLRALGRMGALLLPVIGGTSCDNEGSGPNGSPGGLALVTSTTGVQPDGDGYTIMVDGMPHGSIGPNDSLTVAGIDPGSHAVELSDIEFNCATLGQFTRTVAVSADAGAVVHYSVACDARSRSRIAFVGDRDFENAEVFVMNADGTGVTSLKDSVGAIHVRSTLLPSVNWSADGNRLAFTRADGALYATTGAVAGVIQLAAAGMTPIWSEGGEKVAFLLADPGTQGCCWNIFVAEGDGSAVVRVTEGLSLSHYDFAANGSLLAYVVEENATSKSLDFVRPDGTGRREFVPPGVCCIGLPSLSPDGSQVAYYAYPHQQGENGAGAEVYVAPTDGSGAAINVSNNPGDDTWPVWSPDGTTIAFVSSEPGGSFGRGSIHVVKADGSGQTALTPADGPAWGPAWSPDGTRIAYSGVVGVDAHIFVANADGSGRTDVTPNRDSSRPTWTGR